ncbi:MAG: shikimate kinase [bacterium]|nr:shikimate kinase [bacterium]
MRIFLLGFMTAGKSSIGPVLARRSNLPYRDLDDMIEDQAGMSIRDIFYMRGEEIFRKLESRALAECAAMNDLVLATGGGIVERQENLIHLQEAYSVYLAWPWATLERRLLNDTSGKRPLATDAVEDLHERWRERDPLYRKVSSRIIDLVDTDGSTARMIRNKEIAKMIAGELPGERA